MNLSDRLVKDFKKYLIEKLTIPKNTVQLLRADILNKSKELQRELSEEEMLEIVAKQIKQKRKVTANVTANNLFRKTDIEKFVCKPLIISNLLM